MFKRISFKSKYGWVSIEQENKKITSVSFGKTKNIGYSKKLINLKKLISGQNKHLIIVPCHRDIRSDKKLGGFSGTGGIKMKQRLLNLEKSI